MLVFALIGLSFVLLGVVGLQFTYMFYVERMNAERRKYLQALENRAEQLAEQLDAAHDQIAAQNELLKTAYRELGNHEEVWAELIDER